MWMQTGKASDADPRVLAAGALLFLMFIFSMAMWPVYIAGIQIITTEIAAGRRIGFFTALNEAVRFWPRVAALCVFVFVVFALLTLFGLGIALIVVAGASSLMLIFVALALLACRFGCSAGFSSMSSSGSSLPSSKTPDSSIRCAKVEI